MEVKCEVSILTPFEDISKQITNQVLLLENIIIGKIPTTYYNLEGINENDKLEVINWQKIIVILKKIWYKYKWIFLVRSEGYDFGITKSI